MTKERMEVVCMEKSISLRDVGYYRKGVPPIIHTFEGDKMIEHQVDPNAIIGECDNFVWVDRRSAYRLLKAANS